jgi:hypothetical protein
VGEILATHFGGPVIDLVIDDASHEYAATKVLFETVFPFVRPGGAYLIEDWCGESGIAFAIDRELRRTGQVLPDDGRPPSTPLTRLALELVLAKAESADVIDEVQLDTSTVLVRRGPAPLDPSGFRLDDVARDFHHILAAEATAGGPS